MRKLFYPDNANEYNVFRNRHLIAHNAPAHFIKPRGNDYSQDDKILSISRYLQEICRLKDAPGIVDSVITRTHEFYKFDNNICVLIKRTPKGD